MKVSHLQTPFLAFALILSTTFPVLAASATPSASPLSSPSDETVTENLKERLIETINQVKPAAEDRTLGYVGRVRDIIQNTVVIEDKSGKKNVVVSASTSIVRSPGNAEIKLENIRIDDGIIAMGIPSDNGEELQGKRIIVSENPFVPPSKTSGIAKVTKLGKNTLSLSAVGSSSPATLTTTSKTVIKSTGATLKLADLTVGDTVIFSALVDAKDPTSLTATVLMRTATSDISTQN